MPGAQRGGTFLTSYGKVLWPLLTLVAILLFNLLFTKDFFVITFRDGHLDGNVINILKNGAPVMLLSMGMTLVIATAGIDLSVGSVMAIAGATAAVLISRPDYAFLTRWVDVHGGHVDQLWSLWGIIGLALLAAIIVGVVNGLLVAVVDLQPIVATLIMMIVGQGIAELITDNRPTTFDTVPLPEGVIATLPAGAPHALVPVFLQIGRGFMFGLPIAFLIALVMAGATALLVRGTALGLFLESIGNNATASRYAGINARIIKIVAYLWCALCAGIAGLIPTASVANLNPAAIFKESHELDGILAAAIGGASLAGGRFSLAGSLLGALVIQLLTTTMYSLGVSTNVAMIAKAGVVVGVCLLQSDKFRALAAKPFRRACA